MKIEMAKGHLHCPLAKKIGERGYETVRYGWIQLSIYEIPCHHIKLLDSDEGFGELPKYRWLMPCDGWLSEDLEIARVHLIAYPEKCPYKSAEVKT